MRSHDRATPEELNRRVVGVLADLHCAPTEQAVRNLRREGVPDDSILLTGNTIVEATKEVAPDDATGHAIATGLGAEPGEYVLATIHRPENTDDPQRRLGQRDRDLQGGTVHEAALRYQRSRGAHRASLSGATMMTVSRVRLMAMQTMLTSEPRTRCPTW